MLVRNALGPAAKPLVVHIKAANAGSLQFAPHWAIRVIKRETERLESATGELKR